jgi:hypothetical protein
LEGLVLRGKPWTIDEERQLRKLVKDGNGLDAICQAMGKGRVSVRAKMFNLGLTLVDATVKICTQDVAAAVAAVPSPFPSVIADPVVNVDFAKQKPIKRVAVKEEVTVDLKINTVDPLPSIEEKIRHLNAALDALEQPGLSSTEISRLTKIIQGVNLYEKLYAHFLNYKKVEEELLEIRRQLTADRNKS